jgi:hypothetical protein
MPGNLLTTASTVMCPHGGSAVLTTSNAKVKADGAFVLLVGDVHPVAGCAFTVGTKYSPCVKIEWQAGAGSVQAGGAPLVQSSVGLCKNGEGAPQGTALISATQARGAAR